MLMVTTALYMTYSEKNIYANETDPTVVAYKRLYKWPYLSKLTWYSDISELYQKGTSHACMITFPDYSPLQCAVDFVYIFLASDNLIYSIPIQYTDQIINMCTLCIFFVLPVSSAAFNSTKTWAGTIILFLLFGNQKKCGTLI